MEKNFVLNIGAYIENYQILAKIGAGGMGVVFKSHDVQLNRIVAIKFILNQGSGELASRNSKRFQRELEISASLDHSYIVKVYKVGLFQGFPYMVMEYVDGMPLLRYVEANKISLQEQLRIVCNVAEALSYAHKKKVIHRDIKPSNIMVRKDGNPVLMDFGLAKLMDTTDKSMTKTGEILGTPQYMSPEQAEGLKRVDYKTDIYSLGAVLYYLLTGRPPVEGDSLMEAVYFLTLNKRIPPRQINPDISEELEKICLRALEKKKENRYPSAKEFALDISRYLEGKKTVSRKFYANKKLERLTKSALVFGILLAALWMSAGFLLTGSSAREAQEKKEYEDTVAIYNEGKKLLARNPEDAYILLESALHRLEKNKKMKDATDKLNEIHTILAKEGIQKYRNALAHWRENSEDFYIYLGHASKLLGYSSQYADARKEILALLEIKKVLDAYFQRENEDDEPKIEENLQDFQPGLKVQILLDIAKKSYHCCLFQTAEKYLLKAENIMPQASEQKNLYPYLYYYSGRIYFQKLQFAEAMERFNKATQFLQDVPDAQTAFPYDVWLYHYAIKLIDPEIKILPDELTKIGDYLKSKENISYDTEHQNLYWETMARYLLKWAETCQNSPKDFEHCCIKAIQLIDNCMATNDTKGTLYYVRGKAYRMLKEYPKALQDFDISLELNPSDLTPLREKFDMFGDFVQPEELQEYEYTFISHFQRSIYLKVTTFSIEFEKLYLTYRTKQVQFSQEIPFSDVKFNEYYEKLWHNSPFVRDIAMNAMYRIKPYTKTLEALEKALKRTQTKDTERYKNIQKLISDMQNLHAAYQLCKVRPEGKIANLNQFKNRKTIESLQSILLSSDENIFLRFLAARVLVCIPSIKIRQFLLNCCEEKLAIEDPKEEKNEEKDQKEKDQAAKNMAILARKILIVNAFQDIGYHYLAIDDSILPEIHKLFIEEDAQCLPSISREFLQTLIVESMGLETKTDGVIMKKFLRDGTDRVKCAVLTRILLSYSTPMFYSPEFDKLMMDSLKEMFSDQTKLDVQAKMIGVWARVISRGVSYPRAKQQINMFLQARPDVVEYMLAKFKEIPVPVLGFLREAVPEMKLPESEIQKLISAVRPSIQNPSIFRRCEALMTCSALSDNSLVQPVSWNGRSFFEKVTILVGVLFSKDMYQRAPKMITILDDKDLKIRYLLWNIMSRFTDLSQFAKFKIFLTNKIIGIKEEEKSSLLQLMLTGTMAYLCNNHPKIVKRLQDLEKNGPENLRGFAFGVLLGIYTSHNMPEAEEMHQRVKTKHEDYKLGAIYGYSILVTKKMVLFKRASFDLDWKPELLLQARYNHLEVYFKEMNEKKAVQETIFRMEKALEIAETLEIGETSKGTSLRNQKILENCSNILSILYEKNQMPDKAIDILENSIRKLQGKNTSLLSRYSDLCVAQNQADRAKFFLGNSMKSVLEQDRDSQKMEDRDWEEIEKQDWEKTKRQMAYSSQIIKSAITLNYYNPKDEFRLLHRQYLLAPEQPLSLFIWSKHYLNQKPIQYVKALPILAKAETLLPKSLEVSFAKARVYIWYFDRVGRNMKQNCYDNMAYNLKFLFNSITPDLLGKWSKYPEIEMLKEQGLLQKILSNG